jgi:hypothetical protein
MSSGLRPAALFLISCIAMTSSDRTIKRERVKAIGRTVFRLARAAPIEGFIEPQGQRLRLRTFDRSYLSITLYEAANREPSEDDVSRLSVSYAGRKTLDIRWSASGIFRTVKFEPGDWERLPVLDDNGSSPSKQWRCKS